MTELNCPSLILETQEYVTFHGTRDSATVIKDIKRGRLSWIIRRANVFTRVLIREN